MKVAKNWKDYEILKTSNGEKLERWKDVYLLRPDPQIIWKGEEDLSKYKGLHAHYKRSNTGGGAWENLKKYPEEWVVGYDNLKFKIKPMGFKHTGLFPEQAVNWDMMQQKIKQANRPISVLNLFAYTGGATVACLNAGASVVHVDCAKNMVERAKENVELSGLKDASVRYIVEDCKKFVEREIRRGHKYDAIIMDPPSYGRSSDKEVWNLEKDIFDFVNLCTKVLSDNPLFVLINSYATGLSESVMENILRINLKNFKGDFESYEIGLPTKENINLPCGTTAVFLGKNKD